MINIFYWRITPKKIILDFMTIISNKEGGLSNFHICDLDTVWCFVLMDVSLSHVYINI